MPMTRLLVWRKRVRPVHAHCPPRIPHAECMPSLESFPRLLPGRISDFIPDGSALMNLLPLLPTYHLAWKAMSHSAPGQFSERIVQLLSHCSDQQDQSPGDCSVYDDRSREVMY
eukprot:221864-Pleurochrysis_carterae.AAC.3